MSLDAYGISAETLKNIAAMLSWILSIAAVALSIMAKRDIRRDREDLKSWRADLASWRADLSSRRAALTSSPSSPLSRIQSSAHSETTEIQAPEYTRRRTSVSPNDSNSAMEFSRDITPEE